MLPTVEVDPKAEGKAPDVMAPGPVGSSETAAPAAPVLTAPALAAGTLATAPRRALYAWIVASLVLHGILLSALVARDQPALEAGEEAIPVEIVLEPLDVSPQAGSVEATPEPPTNEEAKVEPETQPEVTPAEAPAPTQSQQTAEAEPAPQPPAVEPAPAPPPEPAPALAETISPPATPEPEGVPLPVPRPRLRPPPAPQPQPQQAARSRPQPRAEEPRRPARPAAVAAVAPPRAEQPSPVSIASWQRAVMGRLSAAMRYPESARSRGATGRAAVSFSVDDSGRLTRASLASGTGQADLDSEATAIVRRAGPFPPPPPGAPRTLTVPINFNLR